jgi:branched-subunit amino acid ABC-type transport system permease component
MPGVMRKPRRQSPLLHLVLTLFGVGAGLSRFLPSLFRSRSSLVAENLFLRKQLAFYQEREVEPRRLTAAARVCLLVWFLWSAKTPSGSDMLEIPTLTLRALL